MFVHSPYDSNVKVKSVIERQWNIEGGAFSKFFKNMYSIAHLGDYNNL